MQTRNGGTQIVLKCNVIKTKVAKCRDPGVRGRDTGCGRHSSPPLGWRGHAHTWWPCPGQQSDSWSCFRRRAACPPFGALFKTFASDELVMMCGAQRAHQCSGSVAHDAPPPSLRWQASFQRVPHGQAAGMRCRRQAPVQLADAKLVEALLKPAVRAANHIGEGGRTHRDDQRSEQQRWHNLMSKVPMRPCWAWARERPAACRESPDGALEPRSAQGDRPQTPTG